MLYKKIDGHYTLYGTASELRINTMYQSLTIDKKAKKGIRGAMSGSNHWFCISESTQSEKVVEYQMASIPQRVSIIGYIQEGKHYRIFKRIVDSINLSVDKKVVKKCREHHLYWISMVVKRCIKAKILLQVPNLAELTGKLFIRGTVREGGPGKVPEPRGIFRAAKKWKDYGKRMAIASGAMPPPAPKDSDLAAHPFAYDPRIVVPDSFGTNGAELKAKKEVEAQAKKDHEKAVAEGNRLRRRALWKTKRGEDGKVDKNDKYYWLNNMENARPIGDGESIAPTESDFASGIIDTPDDADFTPKKQTTYQHRPHDSHRVMNWDDGTNYSYNPIKHRYGHGRSEALSSHWTHADSDAKTVTSSRSSSSGSSYSRRRH